MALPPHTETHLKQLTFKHIAPSTEVKDLLTAIAVLAMSTALADGHAQPIEFGTYLKNFQDRFLISKDLASRIAWNAIKRIQSSSELEAIDESCAVLNGHLTKNQRQIVLDILVEIVLVDKDMHASEIFLLSTVREKLGLTTSTIGGM